MTPSMSRMIVVSLAFMVAFMVLSPLGLGWSIVVAYLAYLGFWLYRTSQRSASTENDSGERVQQDAQTDAVWPLKRMRERGKSTAEDRQRLEQERAHREADCGLTHEERVEFQGIIEGLNDDKA
jgi:hypothetical protein